MAPTPKAVSWNGPSVLFRLCSPVSFASLSSSSNGLVANKLMIPPRSLSPPFAGSAPDEIDRRAQEHDDQPWPGVVRLIKKQQDFNQARGYDVQGGQDRVSKGSVRSLHVRPGAA